jgi:hypothetical protein
MKIVIGTKNQSSLHRILANVVTIRIVILDIAHSSIIEAGFPNLPAKAKFLLGSKGKASFDQLQRSFECQSRCEQ